MSRSRRKTPIVTNAGKGSEKQDKKRASKRLRVYVNALLKTTQEDVLTESRELSNPYGFSKDGKHYWDNPKAYRK